MLLHNIEIISSRGCVDYSSPSFSSPPSAFSAELELAFSSGSGSVALFGVGRTRTLRCLL